MDTRSARRYVQAAAFALILILGMPAWALAQFPLLPGPSPSPGGPQPTPSPTDPRAAQIRAGMEKQGLRVLEIYSRQTRENETQWWAETAANYAQPSGPMVVGQALKMWVAMYEVLARDAPTTVLSNGQLWTKYSLIFHARLGAFATLVSQYNAAKTDGERQQAFETFFRTVNFRVYDNERRQFVDDKDFINKNFTQ
jgi:hypothetical protein